MGEERKPSEDTQDGDSVSTGVSERAADNEEDLQALLEQAEAEAAEAEAAAATARARVRSMRGEPEPAEGRFAFLRRPGPSRAAKVLAVIVIVCSLAGSGYVIWQHREVTQRRQQADAFRAAAEQGVVALTSLDFKHAKEDVKRIADNATGAYKDDFMRTADDFVKIVETSKVVSKGSVRAAAVESMNDNSAVVLTVVEEQITNSAGAKQDPRIFRMRVTVTRDGDAIKLSQVELVP